MTALAGGHLAGPLARALVLTVAAGADRLEAPAL
jgi:hypothetical protein